MFCVLNAYPLEKRKGVAKTSFQLAHIQESIIINLTIKITHRNHKVTAAPMSRFFFAAHSFGQSWRTYGRPQVAKVKGRHCTGRSDTTWSAKSPFNVPKNITPESPEIDSTLDFGNRKFKGLVPMIHWKNCRLPFAQGLVMVQWFDPERNLTNVFCPEAK